MEANIQLFSCYQQIKRHSKDVRGWYFTVLCRLFVLGLKILSEYVLMYQAKGAFKAVIVSCGTRLKEKVGSYVRKTKSAAHPKKKGEWWWSAGRKGETSYNNNKHPSWLTAKLLFFTSWRHAPRHGVPEALVVQTGLAGHPGRVPAGVLLLIRAADLVSRHRSRLKAQGSVVGTFCGWGQMQRLMSHQSLLAVEDSAVTFCVALACLSAGTQLSHFTCADPALQKARVRSVKEAWWWHHLMCAALRSIIRRRTSPILGSLI